MNSLQLLFSRSEKVPNLLPSLLSYSSILLKNIHAGLHSTRFAGKGESFWQFKEYSKGESIINIDWRKSASSNKVLIKQNEKELSKTIYLYFDILYSMNYKSKNISSNKLYFSALLTLTLCKLFSKNKEKVFIFNSDYNPINCSTNINNFNNSFLKIVGNIPSLLFIILKISLFLCIIFSDFFYEKRTSGISY